MTTLRLFATIRVAAGGEGRSTVEGGTVAEVIESAIERYGPGFAELVPICRVWVNGQSADPGTVVGAADEVALLPPVSGG